MDVRCEQCGTEYEFDDAKVTDAGIAVKCTHCGFLFRVTRHSVTVDERPVIAEARPSRPTTTTEMAQLPRAGTPARSRGWMIRKERSTDVLEFKDLSTLQKWILERKVSRDDEISKTGESWKPLGSIVELSSFFLVVEGEALRNNGPIPAPEPPAPPTQTSSQLAPVRPNLAPPAPPRGRDDLLDTGQFRLEGPGEAPTPVHAPITGSQQLAQLQVTPQAPGPTPAITETAAMRRVQIPASEPGPQVTVLRTPAPRTPLRQETSVPGFDLGGGSAPATRGNTARGFVIGVGVTGALFAVAYGAFEHLNTDKGRTPLSRPAVATTAPANPASPVTSAVLDLPTRLDAADARVRTDADSELDLAIPDYDAILAALGEPPSDRVLAARALVGKARVLLARAEHRMLGGDAPGALLAKVNDLLGTARVHAPDLADIELAWADSLRLRDERVSVRNFLDAAAPKASSRPEYVFLRAMIEGSDDPGAVSDRLAALPPEARSVPRVLLIRGLALEKSGRRDEALQVVMELLRATPSHAQGIDLKTRLTSGTAPPGGRQPGAVRPGDGTADRPRHRRARRPCARHRRAGQPARRCPGRRGADTHSSGGRLRRTHGAGRAKSRGRQARGGRAFLREGQPGEAAQPGALRQSRLVLRRPAPLRRGARPVSAGARSESALRRRSVWRGRSLREGRQVRRGRDGLQGVPHGSPQRAPRRHGPPSTGAVAVRPSGSYKPPTVPLWSDW
jgi:predicted Zn finger-like uncharacterized protein